MATNSPGHSAFNRIECRIIKLSKELSGFILKHDKFGNQLDAKSVAIDKNLELKNFEYTGRTLAKIWSGLMIDGNHVVAEFTKDDAPVIMGTKPEEWKAYHLRQPQYFIQIVKCAEIVALAFNHQTLMLFLKIFYH